MSQENKKVSMSISVDPELPKSLDIAAKKAGFESRSELLTALINRHLNLLVNDGEISIVLKIPKSLEGDKEALQEWFDQKAEHIISQLS